MEDDEFYEYDEVDDCDCSNADWDILTGEASCFRCGRKWALSSEEIGNEIRRQAEYCAEEAEGN